MSLSPFVPVRSGRARSVLFQSASIDLTLREPIVHLVGSFPMQTVAVRGGGGRVRWKGASWGGDTWDDVKEGQRILKSM